MNYFYVIVNNLKENALKQAARVKKYLEERGKICYLQEYGEDVLPSGNHYTDPSLIPEEVECVIAIGGDGTLLHASRDILQTGLPILGINMGTLGYLAEIEVSNVTDALDRLVQDRYSIEDRMMIRGTVYRAGGLQAEDIALNDIVITRRGRLRVVDFNIYVDDTFLCSYRADGIIISTPTGSTGYTLSAGGPIVSPDASLILLTALAPHTLGSRTIVLPDNVSVTVEVCSGTDPDKAAAEIYFDGDTYLDIACGEKVIVDKTRQKTHFIKLNHTSFVTNLREKLK
jgi:NAD+ kinase